MFSTKFRVNWPFSLEEEAKSRWRLSWISDQNIFVLSIFDLQVTPKLPAPGRVNWPFSSEDAKNRFF